MGSRPSGQKGGVGRGAAKTRDRSHGEGAMSKDDERSRDAIWSGLEEDDPVEDRECGDCRKQAPAASSALTLISSKYGWRLVRTRHASGVRMEWLCPQCSAARREEVAAKPRSSSGGLRLDRRSSGQSDPAFNPAALHDMRATGASDIVSSVCKSLATKLRSRVRPCATSARLLRAVLELEAEIVTWSDHSGTPERRAEVWATIVLLNGEADDLIASRK